MRRWANRRSHCSAPSRAARNTLPAGILFLVFILAIWNPASLAQQAASAVWNIESRSALSLVFLAARLIITGVGVAAGIALWRRRPGAVWLARLSLVLFSVEAVVRLSSRVDLGSAPPGTRLPMAGLIIVHNAALYLYLQLSRRVRAVYGLESQTRNG
jgi:hypothetical protein